MRFKILLSLFLISSVAFAQEIDTIYGMGTSANEHMKAMHRDQDGNIYMLQSVGSNNANFFGTLLYYDFPGSGSNLWFAKLDSNFNLQWHMPIHTANSTGIRSSIDTDDEGNVYLSNTRPKFTYKFNSVGDLLWESPYAGHPISYDKTTQTIDLFELHSPNDSIMGEYIDSPEATVLTLNTDGEYHNHFSLDIDEYPDTYVKGKNSHGYFGVRSKPPFQGSGKPTDLFLCDSNGSIIKSEYLNKTDFAIDLVYSEELQKYFANGFLVKYVPLDNPISDVPTVANYILQLDNDFTVIRSLRLSNSNGIYAGTFIHLHPHGENIYLSGGIIREWAFSHLGQQHFLNAKEDNVIFAKLDKTLRPKWIKILETEYFANSFIDFFASDDHLFFPGNSSGHNGGPNNPFPIAGGSSDIYMVKMYDHDSLSTFVQGRVFIDENQNGIDDNESGYGFHNVMNEQTLSTQYVHSDGDFEFSAPAGENVFKATSEKPYLIRTTPDNFSLNVEESDSLIISQGFGIYLMPGIEDAVIHINELTPSRPGFDVMYKLTFRNDATETLDGEIRLSLDRNLTFLDASILPDSILENEIVWIYSNLIRDEKREIFITTNLAPIVDLIGNNTMNTVEISPIITDTIPINNRDTLLTLITGSFDPNDINVYPKCIDINTNSPTLDYKVRFQNTGTDTAFTVLIKSELSSLLDPSSLRFKESSHPLKMELNGNNLQFLFEDILLPDSTANLIASNGFVNYSIQAKSEIDASESISNQAAIFFDYNPPILTNEVMTSIYEGPLVADTIMIDTCSYYITTSGDTLLYSGIYASQDFSETGCPELHVIDLNISPINPMINVLGDTLFTNVVEGALYQWLDCNAEYIPIDGATNPSFIGDSGGIYALEIIYGDCRDTSVCEMIIPLGIKDQSNDIKIYPNPFDRQITIQVAPNSILGIEMFSIHGESISRFSINTDRYINLTFDNTLENGAYILKVKTKSGWKSKLILKR